MLDAGLGREKVVQILSNLGKFRDEKISFLIPEAVKIKFGLIPASEIQGNSPKSSRNKSSIPETNTIWLQSQRYNFGTDIKSIISEFELKSSPVENSLVVVGLEVDLGFAKLSEKESNITLPRCVFDNNKPFIINPCAKGKIKIKYEPGELPKGTFESELSSIYNNLVNEFELRSIDISEYKIKMPDKVVHEIMSLDLRSVYSFYQISNTSIFTTASDVDPLKILAGNKFIYFYHNDKQVFRVAHDLKTQI